MRSSRRGGRSIEPFPAKAILRLGRRPAVRRPRAAATSDRPCRSAWRFRVQRRKPVRSPDRDRPCGSNAAVRCAGCVCRPSCNCRIICCKHPRPRCCGRIAKRRRHNVRIRAVRCVRSVGSVAMRCLRAAGACVSGRTGKGSRLQRMPRPSRREGVFEVNSCSDILWFPECKDRELIESSNSLRMLRLKFGRASSIGIFQDIPHRTAEHSPDRRSPCRE